MGSLVAGDFNGDGIPDLASTDEFTGSVTVYLGNGDGTFKAGTTVLNETSGGGSLVVLATGDFNSDGKLDLAVPVYSNDALNEGVAILLGNGDGTFHQANGSPITVGNFANRALVGDFNGDGIPDVLVGGQSSTTDMYILLGNGDGTFTLASTETYPCPAALRPYWPTSMATALRMQFPPRSMTAVCRFCSAMSLRRPSL